MHGRVSVIFIEQMIPYAARVPPKAACWDAWQGVTQRGRRILVLDDEPQIPRIGEDASPRSNIEHSCEFESRNRWRVQ
jgi:hypothetical protein